MNDVQQVLQLKDDEYKYYDTVQTDKIYINVLKIFHIRFPES